MPLRILLVEDIAVNQKVARQILKRLGYSVDLATNGREALEVLRHQTYDVVFMDVQMPLMNGLEATRRIREDCPKVSQPWIIAMTAHFMQSDCERCLLAGMNDYISKPIQVQAIVKALNNFRKVNQTIPSSEKSTDVNLATNIDSTLQTATCLISAPAIDAQVLQDLKDMAGEDVDELLSGVIDSYLKDAPQRLQAIRLAIAQENNEELRSSAHALRSLSVTLGAIVLAQICEELEAIGGAGTTINTSMLVSRLDSEYKRVEAALQLEHPRKT
ncbi:MAG: hypothetical protein NVS2B14_11760 [Chamaesiphon sp.]